MNEDGNFETDFPSPPIGHYTKVQVSQELMNNGYVYKIAVGKDAKFSIVNFLPAEFRDVKVFAADPWYTVQPGFIKNLSIFVKTATAKNELSAASSPAVPLPKQEEPKTDRGAFYIPQQCCAKMLHSHHCKSHRL